MCGVTTKPGLPQNKKRLVGSLLAEARSLRDLSRHLAAVSRSLLAEERTLQPWTQVLRTWASRWQNFSILSLTFIIYSKCLTGFFNPKFNFAKAAKYVCWSKIFESQNQIMQFRDFIFMTTMWWTLQGIYSLLQQANMKSMMWTKNIWSREN